MLRRTAGFRPRSAYAVSNAALGPWKPNTKDVRLEQIDAAVPVEAKTLARISVCAIRCAKSEVVKPQNTPVLVPEKQAQATQPGSCKVSSERGSRGHCLVWALIKLYFNATSQCHITTCISS